MTQLSSLDYLSTLIEAAAGVIEETDLERVLRRLVSEARSATGARYAALGVIGEHGVLSEFLYQGISEEQAKTIGNLPTGRGVLGTVIRRNQTILLDSIAEHPDTSGFPPNHPAMSNFLGVPVAVGDEAFGNLYLTEKEGGFTERDVVIVEALSRIAGAAVRTARLQDRLHRVAVVEDRQRIARELHDSVIQELFAVGLGLQGLSQLVQDPQAEATLMDAVDRLDRAVESLRGYVFQLQDTVQARPGLDERLQQLVARMGSAYPTDVLLDVGLAHTGNDLLDNEIVKLVTELLSNALRHGSSDKIEVSLERAEETCVLRVTDDGIGFDPALPRTGMGLDNIHARVGRLGGRVTIISAPGQGTRVEVTLPLS